MAARIGIADLARGASCVLVPALLLLAGCGFTQSAMSTRGFTSRAESSAVAISSEATARTFLFFGGRRDVSATQAYAQLEAKCRGGDITRIEQRSTTTDRLVLSTERVRIDAVCMPHGVAYAAAHGHPAAT